MSVFIRAGLYFIILSIAQLTYAGWEQNVGEGQFRVNVRSEASYSTQTEDLGFNHSHVQIQWINNQETNLNEAIYLFKQQGADAVRLNKLILGVSAKFSVAPFIVKGNAEDKAMDALNDQIEIYRSQVADQEAYIFSQIESAIDSAIQANPSLAPYRESLIEDAKLAKKPLFDQLATAQAQIDAQEALAKSDLSHRADELVKETAVQEVALELGYVLEGQYLGGQIALFARMGKINIEGGPLSTSTGQSSLEQISAQNVLAQRGMSASATTGARFTKVYHADSYSVQTDVYVFHDRIPWVNAEQYVTTVLAMNKQDWERHDDLGDIDSAMARILFENEFVDIYVSVGTYDGESAYGAGGVIKFSRRDRIYVDYFSGDRENVAKRGTSAYYVHAFEPMPILGPNIYGYAGVEDYKEATAPHIFGGNKVDYRQFGVGAAKKGRSNVMGQKFYWSLKAGVYRADAEETNTGLKLKSDNYGIITFGAQW